MTTTHSVSSLAVKSVSNIDKERYLEYTLNQSCVWEVLEQWTDISVIFSGGKIFGGYIQIQPRKSLEIIKYFAS